MTARGFDYTAALAMTLVLAAGASCAKSGSGSSLATGGASRDAGLAASAGAVANGGVNAGGSATGVGGGEPRAGGANTAGGGVGAGGDTSAGGGSAMGGLIGTGGAAVTGGATGSGGLTGAGGLTGSSGSLATGGLPTITGGASGTCPTPNPNLFAMGADVSQIPQDEAGGNTRFLDTDGTPKDILAILKKHGFNYIRLRTFVDPTASDGYSSQGYCDIAHTVAMAKRVKQACMGFLLDFHYSDNWADPAKQCIPVAWQKMTLAEMTQQVHDYTYSSIKQLVEAGARPDVVQIGNEITPGMLIHICDSAGIPTATNAVNGGTANWNNLAGFLNAGIHGVHDVEPTIQIMLHTHQGGSGSGSSSWISSALSHNVAFDVYGNSCYVAYQGQPSVWQTTFNTLSGNSTLANLKFAVAEYNNEAVTSPTGTTSMRDANDVMFNMANNRGFGTFFWEPTRTGAWGNGLFTWSGRDCAAVASVFADYDRMKTAFAGRL